MHLESESRIRLSTLHLAILALCATTFFSPVDGACNSRIINKNRTTNSTKARSRATVRPPQKLETVKPGFDYARQKIRGVNLGGWLVAEPFIVPSIFDVGNSSVIDEFTLSQALGRAEATRRLSAHWDSFYSEKDFQAMNSYGLNHVRIPIGYWAFDISQGEPYVQGQYEYLQKAVAWSKNAGLRVLIDLHGAPGSQNGYDHSGKKGQALWDSDPSNVQRTKAVIATLTKEFSKPQYDNVIAGIQVLNEPKPVISDHMSKTLDQFYKDSYDIVRNTNASTTPDPETNLLYNIHDGFLPISDWADFFPKNKFRDVSLDTHIYTVFGNVNLTDEARVQVFCDKIPALEASQAKIWTFVGEFTPAPTDCAPHLNGIGIGARYDGTYGPRTPKIGDCQYKSGSSSYFSDEYKVSLGKSFEIQTTVFEKTSGWMMWTFKTESADDWSYDAGVKGGWIPKNLDKKTYGLTCS